MTNYLIVIVGPTAIGKTELAIRVAKEFHTEIISADSRQFYREINIGTAKPTTQELEDIPHHFINSHSILDEYTVGDYEHHALAVLTTIYQKTNTAVLVGGSGLYINAVTAGFDNLPKAKPPIREKLNQLLKERGIRPLQEQLKQIDPKYYKQVDLNNPQRLIRALEVFMETGKPYSSYRIKTKKERSFKTIKIGLNTNREELYKRINQRVDQMVEYGLVEEAGGLIPYRHLNALNTVGYTELFDYLDGKISLLKAINKIKQNTRRFAKRQLTWFRKDSDIHWFEPHQYNEILTYINKNLIS